MAGFHPTPKPTTFARSRSTSFPRTCAPTRPHAWSQLIRAAGTHLATGFLATPYLLPTLADAGHSDVAYELLFAGHDAVVAVHDRPGRDHGVGALGRDSTKTARRSSRSTTTRRARSSRSFTATSPGSACIDDEPAYRRFRIEPQPGGGITWAQAEHDSPYGRIECRWRLAGDELELTAVVPPGTTAEIVLPDGRLTTAGPGRHTLTTPAGRAG